jgi:hypothetical protein
VAENYFTNVITASFILPPVISDFEATSSILAVPTILTPIKYILFKRIFFVYKNNNILIKKIKSILDRFIIKRYFGLKCKELIIR